MKDLENIIPNGYIEATFAGYSENGLFINVASEINDIGKYMFALYDNLGGWKTLDKQGDNEISYESLSEVLEDDREWCICIVYNKNGQKQATFLRKSDLKVQNECKEEMFDKRSLYGEPIFFEGKMGILPHYKDNGLLALTGCLDKLYTFSTQIKNEIIYENQEWDENDSSKYYIFAKCRNIQGNYVGIISEKNLKAENIHSRCIEYSTYEKDNNYVYMRFCVTDESPEDTNYYMLWSCRGQDYIAPLCRKKDAQYAKITTIEYLGSEGMSLGMTYNRELFGEFIKAEFVSNTSEWEKQSSFEIKEKSVINEEKEIKITCKIDTLKCFDKMGSWQIIIYTCKDGTNNMLNVTIDDSLMSKEFYDGRDTKYKLTFKKKNDIFVVNRVFGHNALFKKNIQY